MYASFVTIVFSHIPRPSTSLFNTPPGCIHFAFLNPASTAVPFGVPLNILHFIYAIAQNKHMCILYINDLSRVRIYDIYIEREREKIELLTCKLNHQELNVYILKHVLRLEE